VEEANALILGQEENIIKVASFTKEDTIYDIQIDQANNRMVSCSCEDSKKSAWTCKHMFLVCKVKEKENLLFTWKIGKQNASCWVACKRPSFHLFYAAIDRSRRQRSRRGCNNLYGYERRHYKVLMFHF
jgi:hypothetical protein